MPVWSSLVIQNHVSFPDIAPDLASSPHDPPFSEILLQSLLHPISMPHQVPIDVVLHPAKASYAFTALLPAASVTTYGPTTDVPEAEALVVSPYTEPSHLLYLHTVSQPNQLLAKALVHMAPSRDDYATAPYIESFNWPFVVDALSHICRDEGYQWKAASFYIVVFRSRVRPTTDRTDLGLMDAKAHEEAMESGGLLKYWFGSPDANCRNLATCKSLREPLFDLADPARHLAQHRRRQTGGSGEGHRRAMKAIAGLYTEWILERLRLIVEPDQEGGLAWDIVQW